MNKQAKLLSSLCLVVATSLFCGCSLVKEAPNEKKPAPLASLLREFGRKGPLSQLRDWEDNVMEPALALEQRLEKKQIKDFAAALKEIKGWQAILNQQEPVKGTDAYLYFGKNYLAKLLTYVETKGAKPEAAEALFEAKLAFLNAKEEVFRGESTYGLKDLKNPDHLMYSNYREIRKQLAMPGVFFPKVEVKDPKDKNSLKVHQPVLWSQGDRFLYVDFVDDVATFVKLYTAPTVPTTTDKKLLKQVGEWEKNLLEPAIKEYNLCMKAKSEQSKAKVYNERAAKKIEPVLASGLAKLQGFAAQIEALPEDNPQSAFYVKQAKLYVANMVQRVALFKELPLLADQREEAYRVRSEARKNGPVEAKRKAEAQWDKAHKALREAITKGNTLEGRLVPEARLVYLDAKRMLQDGDKNYSFPVNLESRLAKNPWQMSVSYWLNMPGQLMESWTVVDPKNPKKTQSKQLYVWALGEEYLIGEFLDSRLQRYKLQRLNKGFWYGR